MAIEAVLLDMDGTTLNTEPVYNKAWKAAFANLGYDFSVDLFNRCIGMPVALIKKTLNEHYSNDELFDLTFPAAAAWAYNYKKLNGIPVKDGFYELMDYLDENGIKAVIATSTAHDAAVEDLTHSKIIDRFIGVVGGDDVKNGKPAPDPYIKAAKLAGVAHDKCIAVEDSANGIRSAAAAGIKCVYVRDFVDFSDDEDINGMIYAKVTNLAEIIDLIKKLFP